MAAGFSLSLLKEMQTVGAIIGGTPAAQGRYPYQAALLDDQLQFCGGSLIAPNVVLSSAGCAGVNATEVALGCADISNLNDCEVISVESTVVFEGFNSVSIFSGDWQLLILAEESQQTPLTIAAPGLELAVGQDLTVIGRGVVNSVTEENSGGVLQEAVVETFSQESCDSQYRDALGLSLASTGAEAQPFPLPIVDDFKFCASADGRDTCDGDDGGPIVLRCDATGQDVQVGVVSFGERCGSQGLPTIYAKVFHPEGFAFINDVVTAQGHSLSTLNNFAQFCVVGATQPPEQISDPPTPFPTFDVSGWTCPGSQFSSRDGCHCNCGIPDPDCDIEPENVIGCQENEICRDSLCIATTAAPTIKSTTPTEAPSVQPTTSPTIQPSKLPTTAPTLRPTNAPTFTPTQAPTIFTTDRPTFADTTPDGNGLDLGSTLFIILTPFIILGGGCLVFRRLYKTQPQFDETATSLSAAKSWVQPASK